MTWLAEVPPTADWIRSRYRHFARRVRGAGFGREAVTSLDPVNARPP